MSKHGYPLYIEQLRIITAVTEALNKLGADGLLSDENHYIHVELRDVHSDRAIGTWCDEISPDAWEFSLSDGEATA